MIIISHRGCWKSPEEQNSLSAFQKSFEMGFGVETDVRDLNGTLVISHDMANVGCLTVEQFLQTYHQYHCSLPLALNIKADGLQKGLIDLLSRYSVKNYFVFDMSVPDTIAYMDCNFSFFSRQSEFEMTPCFYEVCNGIWLDEFYSHWIDSDVISAHLRCEKQICIVSPELHKRKIKDEWKDYKEIINRLNGHNIMLCTDLSEEAHLFFNRGA